MRKFKIGDRVLINGLTNSYIFGIAIGKEMGIIVEYYKRGNRGNRYRVNFQSKKLVCLYEFRLKYYAPQQLELFDGHQNK